jgi:hypothetical protein
VRDSTLKASSFMKSQPDAAGRPAAEVVTQLPVPSRLGMLRFERLNEPSWAMLYLDPNCEKQFSMPAVELCALVGTPYASLMEPEARYQLHDAVQLQLAGGAHYLIRYTLHTTRGPLGLVEIGEAYKQHNRHLLRGYLMVVNEQVEAGELVISPDLEVQNSRLQIALELNQRAQHEQLHHLERVRGQQSLILRLARHRYSSNNSLQEAAELITKSACEIYNISCASLWNLNGKTLEPIAEYRRDTSTFPKTNAIDISEFPSYLDVLHTSRAIDVNDVEQDPRTKELVQRLRTQDITAILDAAVRIDGQVVGVLCLEQTGAPREWQSDEIAFAGELADQFAHAINNHNRRTATSACTCFSVPWSRAPMRFCWSTATAWSSTSTRVSPRSLNTPPTRSTGNNSRSCLRLKTSARCCSTRTPAWSTETAGRASSRAGAKTWNPIGASCRFPRCTGTTAS